jgi:hypothetical protein
MKPILSKLFSLTSRKHQIHNKINCHIKWLKNNQQQKKIYTKNLKLNGTRQINKPTPKISTYVITIHLNNSTHLAKTHIKELIHQI